MDQKDILTKYEKMPLEEKFKLLTETDKAYIREYIEKAYAEQQDANNSGQNTHKKKLD